MSEIFELAKVKNNVVSIKVKDIDNLTRSEYPYVNATMDYISITRGQKHTMTVIKKDGSTWSVDWGYGGTTLCSDSVDALKRAAIDFIEQECGIPLGITGEVVEATIYFNPNFDHWQLTVRDENRNDGHIWFKDADCVADAMLAANKIVNVASWAKGIAQTGITIWRASLA